MRRLLIIGACGTGKSHLARRAAPRLDLPLVHLDAAYWQPGWVETPLQAWRARVEDLIAGERWLIDGNYAGSLPLRLTRADVCVWLDYPRRIYVRRVLRRIAVGYGRVRADLAPGCPERFDLEFLRYVWNFDATFRGRITAALAAAPRRVRVIRFVHPVEAARWLSSLDGDMLSP